MLYDTCIFNSPQSKSFAAIELLSATSITTQYEISGNLHYTGPYWRYVNIGSVNGQCWPTIGRKEAAMGQAMNKHQNRYIVKVCFPKYKGTTVRWWSSRVEEYLLMTGFVLRSLRVLNAECGILVMKVSGIYRAYGFVAPWLFRCSGQNMPLVKYWWMLSYLI